jgi:hypothetical protein
VDQDAAWFHPLYFEVKLKENNKRKPKREAGVVLTGNYT